jgi:hypothetical protein
MFRARASAAAMLAALALACSHTAPPRPGAVAGAPPVGEPRPFAALYRLDCCRQSALLATVRGDGTSLAVTVAAGPAGTVAEAWIGEDGGWLRNSGGGCKRSLPAGTLPLTGVATLPLDPRLAALMLAGTVPPDATPVASGPRWFATTDHGITASWLVPGELVEEIRVDRAGGSAPVLTARLAEHHGRVPGRIDFRAGGESGELRLVEWRSAEPPVRPAWLASPPCEER